MDAAEITKLINQERIRQGMSINELARRTGVSVSNASYWLTGGGITLENADKALKALGIEVTIGGTDEKNNRYRLLSGLKQRGNK